MDAAGSHGGQPRGNKTPKRAKRPCRCQASQAWAKPQERAVGEASCECKAPAPSASRVQVPELCASPPELPECVHV